MPGKGTYTKYSDDNSPRKVFLNKLFPENPGYKGSAYNHYDNAKAKSMIVEEGNKVLRARYQSGDPEMFPKGVDMSYGGKYASSTPPNENHETYEPTRDGDPMNAFVPDISSPGVGKTEGVEKELANNPKSTPQEYAESIGGSYVEGPGTRMPANARVWSRNVLGEENQFNTTRVEQYPE